MEKATLNMETAKLNYLKKKKQKKKKWRSIPLNYIEKAKFNMEKASEFFGNPSPTTLRAPDFSTHC